MPSFLAPLVILRRRNNVKSNATLPPRPVPLVQYEKLPLAVHCYGLRTMPLGCCLDCFDCCGDDSPERQEKHKNLVSEDKQKRVVTEQPKSFDSGYGRSLPEYHPISDAVKQKNLTVWPDSSDPDSSVWCWQEGDSQHSRSAERSAQENTLLHSYSYQLESRDRCGASTQQSQFSQSLPAHSANEYEFDEMGRKRQTDRNRERKKGPSKKKKLPNGQAGAPTSPVYDEKKIPCLPPPPADSTLTLPVGEAASSRHLQEVDAAPGVHGEGAGLLVDVTEGAIVSDGGSISQELVSSDLREPPVTCQPHELNTDWEIGSMVCMESKTGPQYGVIRWMGRYRDKAMVGLELEDISPIGNTGELLGHKLFDCAPCRGLFVQLKKLRLDDRFEIADEESHRKAYAGEFEPLKSEPLPGYIPPSANIDDLEQISGRWKGIQGHYNSCYLDATLYSMFAFCDVFDPLLSRLSGPEDVEPHQEIQRVLREDIVNPLRKNHYVSHDKVLHLREVLDTVGALKGLTHEEKDPEEFLKCLLEEALLCPPFLKFSNEQESHYYQIFCDKGPQEYKLPTMQQILELSFFQADIQLTKVPECFFIQMPRFGKHFRLFEQVLPSLELDITDLLQFSVRLCQVCGAPGQLECRTCFETSHVGELEKIVYCDTCYGTWHMHPDRRQHAPRKLKIPEIDRPLQARGSRQMMELVAVICIETSHYISFVRCGRGPHAPWVFVDSMADRIGGHDDGYNIPEVIPFDMSVISEPEVNRIAGERATLPEHLHRLLSDGYMSLYRPL